MMFQRVGVLPEESPCSSLFLFVMKHPERNSRKQFLSGYKSHSPSLGKSRQDPVMIDAV